MFESTIRLVYPISLSRHVLHLCRRGFKDLLSIGNQSRPKIFDLNIKRVSPLYEQVVEVPERVTLVGFTSDPWHAQHAIVFNEQGEQEKGYTGEGSQNERSGKERGQIVRGISGEAVEILEPLNVAKVKADLETLYAQGVRSLAVVLAHSYTFPQHELLIGKLAKQVGFKHVSLSSQLLPMIKMVSRGVSSTADAYLTPVLGDYLDGFYSGFEGGRDGGLKVEFMGSDGGLCDLDVGPGPIHDRVSIANSPVLHVCRTFRD